MRLCASCLSRCVRHPSSPFAKHVHYRTVIRVEVHPIPTSVPAALVPAALMFMFMCMCYVWVHAARERWSCGCGCSCGDRSWSCLLVGDAVADEQQSSFFPGSRPGRSRVFYLIGRTFNNILKTSKFGTLTSRNEIYCLIQLNVDSNCGIYMNNNSDLCKSRFYDRYDR